MSNFYNSIPQKTICQGSVIYCMLIGRIIKWRDEPFVIVKGGIQA